MRPCTRVHATIHTHTCTYVCVCIVTCLWIRKMLNTKMYQLVIALRGWQGCVENNEERIH